MPLGGSKESGEIKYKKVGQIAGEALGDDSGSYRAEFVDLVRKAMKN